MTSRPSPTFSSLPQEVLTSIATRLPLASALSFALVSRKCHISAEYRIWQHLSIHNPSIITRSPLPGPPADWEIRVRAERNRLGLAGRLFRILDRGSARQWGMVERLSVASMCQATCGVLHLIRLVSNTLRSMEINVESTQYCYCQHDCLDFNLVGSGSRLAFPALTHLHLGKSAVHFIEFLPFLCQLAPHLSTLEVYLNSRNSYSHFRQQDPSQRLARARLSPLLDRPSGIRTLRLVCEDHIGKHQYDSFPTILSLLERSPSIEELYLDYTPVEQLERPALAQAIGNLHRLRYLNWTALYSEVFWGDSWTPPTFARVRELAIGCSQGDFRNAVDSPVSYALPANYLSLETVYCACVGYESLDMVPFTYLISAVPPILSERFTSWIRSNPQLHNYHLFALPPGTETLTPTAHLTNRQTAIISSICYRESEILVVRLRLQNIEVRADEEDVALGYTDIDDTRWRQVLYIERDEAGEPKDLATPERVRTRPAWYTFTDLDGVAIPLEVLERVREVEGGSVDWDRRGVEVGDEAWMEVTDWLEGI